MKKVLLIDSGSGGVNILKECVKVCPNCDYLLLCDDKNLPYGNKQKSELVKMTIENLKNVYEFFKYDIVILACNTLTSTCIRECRKTFPQIVFIGTEPAVKLALRDYEAKDIVVLATPVTIKYNPLLKIENLKLMPMPYLATLIDENLDNLNSIEPVLKQILPKVDAKAVVLGCTHYIAIKEMMREILPNNIQFYDGANGVARRLKNYVGDDEIGYQIQIMTTDGDKMLPSLWWHYFDEKTVSN